MTSMLNQVSEAETQHISRGHFSVELGQPLLCVYTFFLKFHVFSGSDII